MLGVDQRRLLGQGAAGNRAIPATAPLRLQGELASHPEYVEAAVQFKLTEVPPPSDSSSPVEWRAEGIRTFAEFVAGPDAHWRPVQPAKSVLVCIWQLAGKPIRIYTLPLQNFSDKGLKSESPTFELTAEAASGNPVFLLFEDGQPLRKQIAGADATADRLGVLAALGQDAMVAAELRRIGSVPTSEKGAPSLLHLTAQSGALQSLDALLQLGASPKLKAGDDDTPLHLAACNGRTAIVERLIAAKAPLKADNAMKDTPLHLAAAGCHAEACRLLVEAGAPINPANAYGMTPLLRALLADCTPAVELLMARKCDFGFSNSIRDQILVRRAGRGQRRLVQILLAQHANPNASSFEQTALIAAAREGHAEVVADLLAAKADPNAAGAKGLTPLIAAASRGRTAIVRQLLAAGARPAAATQSGFTALHAACFAGSAATVQALLDVGVKADATTDQGVAPLTLALGAGSRETVEKLLDAGAKVEPASPRFEEELTTALAMDSDVFLAAALKEGMPADLQTAKGWSALQLAIIGKSERCAAVLRSAGAKEPDPAAATALVPVSKIDKRPALLELHPTIDPRDPEEGDYAAGTVVVEAIVGQDGVPTFARATCKDCRLSLSAAQTVLRSRFQPALKDGAPVATQVRIPIVFTGRTEPTFDLNALDVKPQVLVTVPPAYPYELRKQGISGQVVMDFVVSPDGSVRDVEVRSATAPAFAASAITAMRGWRFKPGIRDGKAVSCRLSMPLMFELHD
ncbi:MAG: transport protein TonB [Verrucomicrobia bacterium ADurb.Bin122]|nr:MAG: transport protein TonB [Verrucomicrobia bacterium ADurb.Bin122]